MTPLERAARALFRNLNGPDIDPREEDLRWPAFVDDARAVLAAIRYEDGIDEDTLIKVSKSQRVEAVSLALAWDEIIDAMLVEGDFTVRKVKPGERFTPIAEINPPS